MSIEPTRWWQSSSRSSVLSLVVAALAVALPAAEARATDCGGNMVTYSVHYADGTPTNGIRCVVMPTERPAVGRGRVLWYGEGDWGNGNYRHIGVAWESQGIGAATDIYGNGESLSGWSNNVQITFSDAGSPPAQIRVTGDWNEIWRKVDSVSWTPLPRPVTCGPNSETYVASNLAGWQGLGIRCSPKNLDSANDRIWYGAGDRDGLTFAHLGFFRLDNEWGGTGVEYGLCGSGFAALSCDGSVSFSIDSSGSGFSNPWPAGMVLRGSLNELWMKVARANYYLPYKTPYCGDASMGSYTLGGCTSGSQSRGRGPLGPEANAPNTLDGCADGATGTYHSDESIDSLSVTPVPGDLGAFDNEIHSGDPVRIDAKVWAFSSTSNYVDFFYSLNPNGPVWTLIGTAQPAMSGESTVSMTYTLPLVGQVTAIRAQLRYGGAPDACNVGSYNDHDDLVFTVNRQAEW